MIEWYLKRLEQKHHGGSSSFWYDTINSASGLRRTKPKTFPESSCCPLQLIFYSTYHPNPNKKACLVTCSYESGSSFALSRLEDKMIDRYLYQLKYRFKML